MVRTPSYTHFHDLPDVIISNIFSLVTDTQTCNAMSLVCLKWHLLERSTRTSLTLRGNMYDLFLLPTCFQAVTDLDLSLLSPWGQPLLDFSPNPTLLAHFLKKAFPSVVSLTVYARNPSTLQLLAPQWPNLRYVKLVRWHQRTSAPLGSDLFPLFEHCSSLSTLDLSNFYCWTEDILPALRLYPFGMATLSHLNILTQSSVEGFKSHELLAITAACPNLQHFLATCIFDHRYIGFLGDETLLALASNCPNLLVLHLVDFTSLSNSRVDPNDEGHSLIDAKINHTTLVNLFAMLPLLEELVLDVCYNVKDTGPALGMLSSCCPRLKSLKLGQFQRICRGVDAQPDGIALCRGLESLYIKNSADFTDACLLAISLGCQNLAKFEVQGCNKITETGMRKFAYTLRRTLIDVKISCCKQLNSVHSLRALEPIQGRIQRLHIDCVWDSVPQSEGEAKTACEQKSPKKRPRYLQDLNSSSLQSNGNDNEFSSRSWGSLRYLSLRFTVGDLLDSLASAGLLDCPVLEEIQISVSGDCRLPPKPSMGAFGLSSLSCYPQLSRLNLDCSGAVGFALTAPFGYSDLSMWERFYLRGIENLNLRELDYWPPQDVDVNQRTLSLPAAGLLAQSRTLRKLFIHGTANEHFMMFLLKIPTLRDVQLRGDYYPAPENDTSTEMRVRSCCRFEEALNRRRIPD